MKPLTSVPISSYQSDRYPAVGTILFASVVTFTNTGHTRVDVSDLPCRKNMSGEPCADGWCGTTNNVDVQAIGAYRVTGCTVRRIALTPLTAEETAAHLALTTSAEYVDAMVRREDAAYDRRIAQ